MKVQKGFLVLRGEGGSWGGRNMGQSGRIVSVGPKKKRGYREEGEKAVIAKKEWGKSDQNIPRCRRETEGGWSPLGKDRE